MEINELSPKAKAACVAVFIEVFADVRGFLDSVEKNLSSEDLKAQAAAVAIASGFCDGYSNFLKSVREAMAKNDAPVPVKSEVTEQSLPN